MFFFKSKKIVVDCFTDEPGAFEYHPIEKSTSKFPSWWKQLPNHVLEPSNVGIAIERSTMKACDGFLSLYKNSHVLCAWTDIKLRTDNSNYYYYFGKAPLNTFHNGIASHNRNQFGPIFDNKIHLKLMSPWYFRQKQSCDFAMMPAIWNDIDNWNNYTIMPGIGNFKFQHSTNINMFVEKNKTDIFIEAGTPLYHIIPLTEKQVEFVRHLVTPDELNKIIHSRYGTFLNNYKFIKRFHKEGNKCPFRDKRD